MTITSDNGTEFAYQQEITRQTGISWFFADAYKSQQRGCNENQNDLIRHFFKRDKDLNNTTESQVFKIQNLLNSRARRNNKFISPNKLLRLHNVAFAS